MWAERDEVRRIPGRRTLGPPEKLDRHKILERGQIQLYRLRKSRKVCYHQNLLVLIAAKEGQDFPEAPTYHPQKLFYIEIDERSQ